MCIPVIFFGQCLGNAVVEILVVREDDMPANIVELGACQSKFLRSSETRLATRLTKPSGVISVEASPPGVSLESMIIHDGPSCALSELCPSHCVSVGSHQLM